ncbi:GNAT family N-acetyltransferase [Aliivibrio kagoshimensis]|uniref:GNAT family N-acetyltransferase n=1 Tax=Aliivibrio kagoshimensis TaxID=2910230 RepID=UPI003D09E964
MLFRTEAPADILIVDQLLKSTFPTHSEAELVMSLRENGNQTLGVVACTDEGEVIAHALFSPVLVAGEDWGWQGLAPVSVKEGFRKQGIAKQLIDEGITILSELGYPVCVVLGDPAYYQRFGFEAALKHNLHCKWPDTEEAFMVKSYAPEFLESKSGLVSYCAEFDSL